MKLLLAISGLATLATATEPGFQEVNVKDLLDNAPKPDYPVPPIARPTPTHTGTGVAPCTSTLTVTAKGDCGGCTTTSYAATSTQEVDCKGCGVLTTSTTWPIWVGICPACVNGIQTVQNKTGTETVTSCSYAPGALPS